MIQCSWQMRTIHTWPRYEHWWMQICNWDLPLFLPSQRWGNLEAGLGFSRVLVHQKPAGDAQKVVPSFQDTASPPSVWEETERITLVITRLKDAPMPCPAKNWPLDSLVDFEPRWPVFLMSQEVGTHFNTMISRYITSFAFPSWHSSWVVIIYLPVCF